MMRCFDVLGARQDNCTVGWSDIVHYSKVHYAADKVYFYRSKSKKSANFAARAGGACAAKFSLPQNYSDLKNVHFLKI